MDKVSIIIPVYNVEPYLKECLNSVINQSYKNIEIIIINDGSTDGSKKICETYANLDRRIIFIDNHNNKGVSYSRNLGINYATGEYILFIDSDDFIDKKYVYFLMKNIDDKEISICNISDDYVLKKIVKKRNIKKSFTGNFYEDFYVLRDLLRGPVAKLYKTKIIKKNNIKFPMDITVGEDQIFNFKYYNYTQRYGFIDKGLYYYKHRNIESLSSKKTEKVFIGATTKLKIEYDFFCEKKIKYGNKIILESIYRVIWNFFINTKMCTYNLLKERMMLLNKAINIETLNKNKLTLKEKIFYKIINNKSYKIIYIYCMFKRMLLKFRSI